MGSRTIQVLRLQKDDACLPGLRQVLAGMRKLLEWLGGLCAMALKRYPCSEAASDAPKDMRGKTHIVLPMAVLVQLPLLTKTAKMHPVLPLEMI